jgi:energy-coupling factor transport system substrate-specific component
MVTALFGLWPGILVGLFSNLFFEVIKGFPGYLYPFAIVNILTALVTWLHVRYGRFDTAAGALWTIITLSLANAVVGAIIVSVVFGGITNEPVDSIVRAVVATGQSIFTSAFFGRILINIVDKGIAVLIVFPIYRYFFYKKDRLQNTADNLSF